MTYLATPRDSALYETLDFVPNYLRVFAIRPDVYTAWLELGGAVRSGMDLRRYELVTLAAARRLGSAYCGLAHAAVLREQFYDDTALRAIVADHRDARLDPVDVAVMDFAELVAADPTTVTGTDVAPLRELGLSDADIFQIVLAVCIRRFFSGVLSAVGAVPDDVYDRLDHELAAS